MTPRPTPPGRTDINAHVDVLTYREDAGQEQTGPNVELSARRGLTPSMDIGAKLYGLGLEVNSRMLLVSTPRFDLAVVPGAGFLAGDVIIGHQQEKVVTGVVPLLAGVRFDEYTTLVLGAKAGLHWATTGSTETRNGVTTPYPGELVWLPGAVVGLSFAISDQLSLFPEVNVGLPYLTDEHKFARAVWQGGVAFQFHLSR